jgi:hypothetical protein
VHSLKDIEDYNLHVECFEEDLLFGGNEYSSDEDECDDGACPPPGGGEWEEAQQPSNATSLVLPLLLMDDIPCYDACPLNGS